MAPWVPRSPAAWAAGDSALCHLRSGSLQRPGDGCTVGVAMTHAFHADDVDVDPDRARELIEADAVQLVDVRERYEWEAGRIAGARHIEIERLASQAGSLDRERPVLFYCRVGARSGMAANAFRRAGYDAYSVDGGLTEWDRRGLPLEPGDGTVADH
jgi:rhodanese-related sulfurtransferase